MKRKDSDTNGSNETVEERWRKALVEYGVDRSIARQLVADLQVDPTLMSGTPTRREVDTAVREAIENTPFTEYDVPKERVDDLRDELRTVLAEGIRGEIPGPDAAMPAQTQVELPDGPVSAEEISRVEERLKKEDDIDGNQQTETEGQDNAGGDVKAETMDIEFDVDLDDEIENQTGGAIPAMAGDAELAENRIPAEDTGDEEEEPTHEEVQEQFSQDKTEEDDGPAISKAQVRSILIDEFGVSECYILGLHDFLIEGDPEEVMELFEKAWTQRDQAETARGKRDATAAGVLLRAQAEVGLDAETILDGSQLSDAVDQWAEELSKAVLEVYKVIEDGESTAEPEEFRENIETDELTRVDLETIICSQLLEVLKPHQSITGAYSAALQAILDKEPGDAVQAFHYAWQNRSDAEDENESRDAVAAGVGLLAHVSLGIVDEDVVDETEIIEEVAINQQSLGDAVFAVYEAAVDRTPSPSPEELRDKIDTQRDELDRADIETLAMAYLLELLQNDSLGDENSVLETYFSGLTAIMDEELENAVQQLKQTWDSRTDVEGQERIAGIAAGVALLAHVEIGILEPEIIDQKTLEDEIEVYRPELSDAVSVVYDACTGQTVSHSPEELITQAETEEPDIEDLEYIVFASLLNSLVNNGE